MEFIVRPRLGFEPNADVFVDEERAQITVAVEIAGADPDSLRIAVEDGYLQISGRRSGSARVARGSLIQKEIAYGTFAKRIALPVALDFLGEAAASYADGVLVIALPIAPGAYLPAARTEIRMIVKRTLS
jgi:HSP20 family protein